jgi:N-acetylneuraminate synthase/pseudaminic acid synthase
MGNNTVFIVAEISANHAHEINIAKKIIKVAKEIGVDAVKLQTYTADTMTINCDGAMFMGMKGSTWEKYNSYELYKEAATPWEWQKELKEYAEDLELELFSTPFDNTAVDFLESIGVRRYKIASFEAIDIPLIKYTASKGKPMIISTGICSFEEIQEAVKACQSVGNNDITLLKCTSAYPAKLEDMHLMTISDMIRKFEHQGIKVGLSDHSLFVEPAVVATALGATVIEKHITLDRKMKTADSAFSLEPTEFAAMIDVVRRTEKVLGKVDYSCSLASRKHARSLFVVKDIKKGEKFTPENVRSIRPSDGLHPRYYDMVIGKVAAGDLKRGEPLKFEHIEGEIR